MPSSNGRGDKRKINQGRRFEELAARFFVAKGFEVIERNWRSGHKEIDLIVRRDSLIVFVEVKSTYSEKFGHPVERIDEKKIKHLSDAARQYLIANKIEKTDLRFDVVTFNRGELEHYPDAFPAVE